MRWCDSPHLAPSRQAAPSPHPAPFSNRSPASCFPFQPLRACLSAAYSRARLSAYSRGAQTRVGRRAEAVALLDEATSHGLQPNSFMLTAAMQAASHDRRQVLLRVVSQSSLVVYCIWINYRLVYMDVPLCSRHLLSSLARSLRMPTRRCVSHPVPGILCQVHPVSRCHPPYPSHQVFAARKWH